MPSETIHFTSARQLSLLYADDERNLEEAEHSLGVSIASRDDWITVEGKIERIAKLKAVFELLEAARAQGLRIRSSDFYYTLRCVAEGKADELREKFWKALADSPYLFLQLDTDPKSAVPMSPQLDKDANSSIWFFTHTKSDFAKLA